MWRSGWQPTTSNNTSKNPPNVGSGVQNPTPPILIVIHTNNCK
jgi:hypothetical protein